ncbi:MAG: DUF1849 family protein [Bdellovibrionales bacterium]|jgi:hypothetical protein
MMTRFLFLIAFWLSLAVPCVAQEKAGAGAVAPLASVVAPSVVPHKALYKMRLGKTKASNGVAAIDGMMAFDWQDTCDGWAVQQTMQLHISYAEGEASDIVSPAATWESKDGRSFEFQVKRLVGGEEDEAFRGRVKLDEKRKGVAHYSVPMDKKDIAINGDVVFPAAHTLMILQKAQAGEKMFSQRVFDGADVEGIVDISAFIGPRLERRDEATIVAELKGNPLLTEQAWPMRLAFYKPDRPDSEPDYEMAMLMQPNGIARSISIDYADFTIEGSLVKLESYPAYTCPSGAAAQ